MYYFCITGAFLIPFVTCMVICGLPLYYLELSIAQFSGRSTLVVWEICPLLRGKVTRPRHYMHWYRYCYLFLSFHHFQVT